MKPKRRKTIMFIFWVHRIIKTKNETVIVSHSYKIKNQKWKSNIRYSLQYIKSYIICILSFILRNFFYSLQNKSLAEYFNWPKYFWTAKHVWYICQECCKTRNVQLNVKYSLHVKVVGKAGKSILSPMRLGFEPLK